MTVKSTIPYTVETPVVVTVVTVVTVAETLGTDIAAFRSAAVTSENKSNGFARSMLASLVSGLNTKALATSAIIHAFGNPKSPKTGKPIETLRGLDAFNGGGAVRKAAETVFDIFDNIDSDATTAATIRPLVVSFILGDKDAPKSLRALSEGVKAALRAHTKATAPDNSEATAETEAETAATTPAAASDAFDAADAIAKLAVYVAAMSDSDANALADGMDALNAAWNARCDELTARLAA